MLAENYKKYFKMMMDKHNIKSLDQLSSEEKKKFFTAVDKSYKAKNEETLNENPAVIATAARMAIQNQKGNKVSVNTARQSSYSKKDPQAHKKAKSLFQKIKDKFKKKDKKKEKPQSKSSAQQYADLYGGGAKVESTMDILDQGFLDAKKVKSVNEVGMEMGKLKDAIKMFQKKIKKQGMVTNARDEEHLKNLIKVYKEMGGKGIKEGYSMRDIGLSPFFKKLSNIQRQAVSIALVMGGNMTGAVKAIEKIKKGLSKDKKVRNALRLANENIAPNHDGKAAPYGSGYEEMDEAKIQVQGIGMYDDKTLKKKIVQLASELKKNAKKGNWNKASENGIRALGRMWGAYQDYARTNEGTCGYGEDGKLGEEPAGPHLLKKKNESINEKMDKRQAGETLKQLGGNKFIMMTGAKNFAVGPKGMGFKIGRNSKGVNYIRIDLDRGRDLYNMEFIQMRGGNLKVKSKVKGVYNDQLQKMFTKHTGMYTSLGTMGR